VLTPPRRIDPIVEKLEVKPLLHDLFHDGLKMAITQTPMPFNISLVRQAPVLASCPTCLRPRLFLCVG
jgi:hypothetical protein